jgi:hypothetical protein
VSDDATRLVNDVAHQHAAALSRGGTLEAQETPATSAKKPMVAMVSRWYYQPMVLPPDDTTVEQHATWPVELTKPIPPTVVARMLLDSQYQPGSRPDQFKPAHGGLFVFKEESYSTRRLRGFGRWRQSGEKADRWRQSGGKASARDMLVPGGAVRVRRRYGSITKAGSIAYRYHEHALTSAETINSGGD